VTLLLLERMQRSIARVWDSEGHKRDSQLRLKRRSLEGRRRKLVGVKIVKAM
jgi:hypothetical protein